MATVLQLIQGSTTVDLNNGTTTYTAIEYQPVYGGLNEGSISETVEIIITNTSVANLMASRSTIIDMLRRAVEFSDGVTDRVYIKFQPNGAAAAWRSPVYDFRVSDAAGVYGSDWDRLTTILTITWTRANWWEANAETQIPLTNLHGADNTSGLTLDNHYNYTQTRDNTAYIYAASVTGDLPGATRLEITSTKAGTGTNILKNIWIGQNWTTPGTLTHMLEAEDATGGSLVSNAIYSGGAAKDVTMSQGVQTKLLTWALSGSDLDHCKGNVFKFFLKRGFGSTQKIKFQLIFSDSDNQPLWSSPIVESQSWLVADLFTFRLPPWLAGLGNLGGINIELYGTQETSPTTTTRIDFAMLMPLNGYREIHSIGYGIPQNSRLVDDGINERLYIDNGTSQANGAVIGGGNPIMLKPGVDQKLYFLTQTYVPIAVENDWTVSVKLFHRPRRLAL